MFNLMHQRVPSLFILSSINQQEKSQEADMEQDYIDRMVRKLRKKEKKGDLEVEHLLQLCLTPSHAWCEPLHQMRQDFNWEGFNDKRLVPLAIWVDIICEYMQCGLARILELASRENEYSTFALAVLETLSDQPATEGIASLLSNLDPDANDPDYIRKVVDSFNLIAVLGKNATLPPNMSGEARRKLHMLLAWADGRNDVGMQSICLYSLRSVGDVETLSLLTNRSPLLFPYEGIEKKVSQSIKKRLKKSNSIDKA